MSNFIPLTGSTNIVDQIIQRFQGVPSFDFIEYTDAQKVTGQLFFELIGDPFIPYKDLETFAQIEADSTAIDLVNNSTNAQKVIAGIVPQVSGFVIDEPTVNAYTGNDGFILLAITNSISTPEASTLQYRINGGGWIAAAVLSPDSIETVYVVIPDLDNNTSYTLDTRQSLFGIQSEIKTLNLVTTPTVINWQSFFSNQADRNYFYTDSYTNNNTYGVGNKTVMEMIFNSKPMIDAIYGDNQTIGLVDLEANNLSTLAASEKGMVGLANNPTAFEHAIANQDYMTAIDNVDQAVRILILEQTATQDYTNFTNVADFIDDQNAMAEVAASTDAMRALIASANAVAEKVIEPIALNEVFANLNATLIVANSPAAVTAIAESPTAMGVVDANDELLRIMLLELTNQDYTQFANVQAVLDDATAFNAILASTPNIFIGIFSSLTDFANSQTAMTAIAASQNAMIAIAASEAVMIAIAASQTAIDAVIASQTALTAINQNDLALRILVLEQTNQDYTQFANFQAVAASQTAMTAIAASQNAMTVIIASQTALTTVIASQTAMTAIAASQTAMTAIAASQTAMTAVAASQTAMTAIAASETAITAIAASQNAMTAVANSTTALAATFASGVAREAFWDNQMASATLMSNSTSRSWMTNNVSHIQGFEQGSSYIQRYSGKVYVLSYQTINIFNGTGANYRFIQPGNTEFFSASSSTVQRSDRVFPLETRSSQAATNRDNPQIRFVIMDRADIDGVNLL